MKGVGRGIEANPYAFGKILELAGAGQQTGQQRRSSSLLRTLGGVYIGVAVLLAALVALSATWIANNWLQAHSLPDAVVAQAVMLMGFNFACRWPISLYHNALTGSHRLALSSAVSMTINIAAATTSILVLAYGARSIQAFFIVQAAFGLLHAVVLRNVARRVVGERDAPVDVRELRRVWHFSAWMGGVGIAGLLLTQVDKLVLSRTLALEGFGHYMLATLLVSGLQVLTIPMFNAMYPKFAALHARGDIGSLEHLYGVGTRLFSTTLFALAFALVFHTHPLVMIWLRDAAVADDVAPITALLAIGSALNAVMYFPYALQLAANKPKLAFMTIIVLIVLMLPLVLFLATRFGAKGGAFAWVVLGVLYVFLGTWLTGRKVMAFAGWPWLRSHVAVPLVATLLPALLGAWICRTLDAGPWMALGIGGLAALTGLGLGVATSFEAGEFRQVVGIALGRPTRSP